MEPLKLVARLNLKTAAKPGNGPPPVILANAGTSMSFPAALAHHLDIAEYFDPRPPLPILIGTFRTESAIRPIGLIRPIRSTML